MNAVDYAISMICLAIVWLVSWEFMRQENAQLREKNRQLRETVNDLYGKRDRHRPKRREKGKLLSM